MRARQENGGWARIGVERSFSEAVAMVMRELPREPELRAQAPDPVKPSENVNIMEQILSC